MRVFSFLVVFALLLEVNASACTRHADGSIVSCDDPNCETRREGLVVDSSTVRSCASCGKSEGSEVGFKVLACSQCKVTYYCNSGCQSSHWPTHKQTCKRRLDASSSSLLGHDYRVLGISTRPARILPLLSVQQRAFKARLAALDLSSILDRGAGEAAAKAIGQEAFDAFSTQGMGSDRAFQGVVAIVDSFTFDREGDGRLRKQYLERAFEGVGDADNRWMP